MLPTEDLFVYVYVLIDDLITARVIAIPPRPGPVPACSDAELLAIALVRHLQGPAHRGGLFGRSRAGLGAPVPPAGPPKRGQPAYPLAAGRPGSCAATSPRRPPPMTASRSIPARCRSSTPRGSAAPAPGPALAGCTQGSAATPRTPNGATASPLAIKRTWAAAPLRAPAIVPAAACERDVADDLLQTGPPPRDLLAGKGFTGNAFTAAQASRGTAVLLPPAKGQRHRMPPVPRKIIAEWRNRIETTFTEITDQMELARHGAHTFWGLLTRTAAIIAAHTLIRVSLAGL
jgi:hypothetical protein